MKKIFRYLLKNKILIVIVLFAMTLTLLPIIFDGQNGCIDGKCGFIVGTNYRDGLWFQAISATSFNKFPFVFPSYWGEYLSGYHFLPNLIVFLLSKAGIPIFVSFYKIIPIFFFATLTILAVSLARKIQDSPLFVFIFLFFTYFGMHLSLFTSLYHFGEIRNGALINTFQATRILESPHLALAMLALYSVLILLLQKSRGRKNILIISALIFLTVGTKFYVSFSISVIVFVFEFILLLKKKSNWKTFFMRMILYGSSGALAMILFYNPLKVASSGATFIFSPFATVHHMIESPDLFYSKNLINARYFLYEAGWSPRLIALELYSTVLFVLFYFGTRALGFLQIIKLVVTKKITDLEVAVSVSVFISIFMAIMFVQKGDWFNPIQFAVPAAYLMNIFLAQFIFSLIKSKKYFGYSLLILLIAATLPANLINVNYLNNPARYVISSQEIEAMKFLKNTKDDGAVFVPIDENDMSYVSAFTGKQTYINNLNVLENAGIDYEKRLDISVNKPEKLFDTHVMYLYVRKFDENSKKYTKLCDNKKYAEAFENDEVIICKKL